MAAHNTCNNSKSDFLAAQPHRERWQEQNLVINSQHLTSELSNYFNCDSDKSLAVSNWAYQVAQVNSAKLWVKKGYFEEAASFKYQQPSTGLDLVAEEKPRYDV